MPAPEPVVLQFYIVLVIALALLGLREDLRRESPSWKTLLSTMSAALGVAGMIFYRAEAVVPSVAATWRFVFPLLIAAGLIDLVFDYRYHLVRLAGGDAEASRALRGAVTVFAAAGIALHLPLYWVNYQVAFTGGGAIG